VTQRLAPLTAAPVSDDALPLVTVIVPCRNAGVLTLG